MERYSEEVQAALELLLEVVGADDVMCTFIRNNKESKLRDTDWFYLDTLTNRDKRLTYLYKTVNFVNK